MGIQSILNALASLKSREPDAPGGDPALPKGGADPKAVEAFTRQMEGGGQVEGPDTLAVRPAETGAVPPEAIPHTLGDRVTAAGPSQQIPETEQSQVTQWLDSVTDILGRESISHAELFRVQALAGLAQIEAGRNASINESLDNSLKTLIKNT